MSKSIYEIYLSIVKSLNLNLKIICNNANHKSINFYFLYSSINGILLLDAQMFDAEL